MKLSASIAVLAGAAQAPRWLDVHQPGDGDVSRREGSFYIIEWESEGSEGTFELQMLSFSNTPIVVGPPPAPGYPPVLDYQWETTVLDGE